MIDMSAGSLPVHGAAAYPTEFIATLTEQGAIIYEEVPRAGGWKPESN